MVVTLRQEVITTLLPSISKLILRCATGYLQYTESKDDHQCSLLDSRYLQCVDESHRESEDDDIGRNREARVGVPELSIIYTGTLDGLVERLGNRGALEYRHRNRCDAVHDHNEQHEAARTPKPLGIAEDSQVK